LWFIRELLTSLTLRSGWLGRFDQVTFEAFLEPLGKLAWPILAVLSDKQKGLPEAVATVLSEARHHFCHSHYLKNLAEPLAQADAAFNVALRKAVRAEVGLLILPADPQRTPPFRLAGIESYQRLQGVVALSQELLAHRQDPRLARLSAGLQTALAPFAPEYHELQQGAAWLRDINRVLEPSEAASSTGEQVAQQLRAYLDDLLALPDLSPPSDALRHHLDKVSTSLPAPRQAGYWPGLFHCYEIEGLPHTNNDLESHFRDTQRRLLRKTRRALQRVGAWELLPRPPTEARCLAALREVPMDQLAKEQERLRRHQQRFCLHTRSIRRVNAQLDKLREPLLALAATSTG
jgi:hypothetical protein